MKKSLLTIAAASAFLLWPMVASAHTVDLCWRNEANGSVTFFAGVYHPGVEAVGGLIVDGERHDFTDQQADLPADISGCQPAPCTNFFQAETWFVVNVSQLPLAPHEVEPSCDSASECGWPFCYPLVEEMGAEQPGDPNDPPPCQTPPEISSSSDELDGVDSNSDPDSDEISDSQSDESVDPNDLDSDSISLDGGPSISLSDYEGCNPYLTPTNNNEAAQPVLQLEDEDARSEAVEEYEGAAGCSAQGTGAAPWMMMALVFGLAWIRRRR